MTLISVAELQRRISDPALRLADVRWYLGRPGRGRREYEAAHLPGAVFVDLDADLAGQRGPRGGRHPLPDPAAFATRLGRLGVGDDHFVVAYDDGLTSIAARLWWMLDSLGHEHVAILDGGMAAWTAAGGELTAEQRGYPPAVLHLADAWRNVISRDELVARLGDVALLDHRAGERYRGETEPVDPVAGHIPTARSAPAAGDRGEDGRFLDPARLASRYRALGAGEEPLVVSCGSGVMACQAALAMRVAGLPDPLLYPGSYSDWSSAGLPIATGSEPGGVPAELRSGR